MEKINRLIPKIIFLSIFLFIFFPLKVKTEEVSCSTTVYTIYQRVLQHKCTTGVSRGVCGGVIEFKQRKATRKCTKTCTTCDGSTSCTDWDCDSWRYEPNENGRTISTYSTQNEPWLVCTYNYGALTDEEKQRAGIKLDKVTCKEDDCPLEEVTWFPPVFNSDSKEYFDAKISGKDYRFFDAAQISCWGGCLKPIEGKPHYFGGSINPTREIPSVGTEGEEQEASAVRLPAKFGWEYDKSKEAKNGLYEWEKAIDWARKQCKDGLEGRDERGCLYRQPPDKEGIKKIWVQEFLRGEDKFEIKVTPTHSFSRDLGVGSFYIKEPVERLLPIYEGQEIPHWQTPASGGKDIEWTRKDMYDYFDYYFLSKTGYEGDKFKFGFSGKLENGDLFVYSPSQDSKKDFLWVEYKDPKENNLTKQIRIAKNQKTHGPCEITPFKTHNFTIYPCCGTDPENCSPKKPDWTFYALGPEIKSILGIKVERKSRILPFSLDIFKTEDQLKAALAGQNRIEGKIYRFIDIDWDRAWPSEVKKKSLGMKNCSSTTTDPLFAGMVKFDQASNSVNECKKKCWKECDALCLQKSMCQKEYEEQCKKLCRGKKECEEKCKNEAKEVFEKIRKEGCPDCKEEEKKLGCIVCKSCEKKCQECINNCQMKDCDELCGSYPDIDLIAARGECHLLQDKVKREICERCKNCNYKADFVDVEWCPIDGGNFVVANLSYKGREESKNFPFEKALEKIYEKEPRKECENVSTPSPCKENSCANCYQYKTSGEEIFSHCPSFCLRDFFITNPFLREINSYKFKCKPIPSTDESECVALFPANVYDGVSSESFSSLKPAIEKLKVVRDIYEEYGGIQSVKKEYQLPISVYEGKFQPKENWWEWDKINSLVNSFLPNSFQLGVCEGKNPFAQAPQCRGSGLRWDFKINTLPKTQFCNFVGENCFGEKEKDYPFCWEIKKEPITTNLIAEKVIEEKGKVALNRIQPFFVSAFVERIFSSRLKIKDDKGNFIEFLPKSGTQSSIKAFFEIAKGGRKFGIEFPFHQIWNALPPLQNAIEKLKKEFTLLFHPCWDELGFFCDKPVEQKAKITGEPPPYPFKEPDSGPPPPPKIRIPHYFNWDPVPGAASYWLKFEGPEEKEIFIRDIDSTQKSKTFVNLTKEGSYTWQIRTCADICSKDGNYLQCGEWGEKIGPFEGFFLAPPTKMTTGKQFYPEEDIEIEWGPIANGTDCTHIKISYVGGMKEKRKDCLEKARSSPEGHIIYNKIVKGDLNGKLKIEKEWLVTSAEIFENKKTGIKTNVCLGDYWYQVRYCTGEDCDKKIEECSESDLNCKAWAECQEAGNWSPLRNFEIVTEKTERRKEEGGGFGTCQNIIPCTDCKFADVPKIISNVISCILWTLSPIACLFLLVYTGIGIYFSFGSPEAVERAKRIWKAVGIGWLAMLLSWTIVNLIGKTFKLPGW